MSDSTISNKLPLAPAGYTVLAIGIVLLFRSLLMPQWSPVDEPTMGLSFLILWIMSVLPVLYLSFRRWAQGSLQSFIPQVFVFVALSFLIQIALNATSIGFSILHIPNSALMPFVWAIPWLALTTIFKTSYITATQCKSILWVIVPLVPVFYVSYIVLPVFAVAYGGIGWGAASLFGMVALCYGAAAWRLRRNANRA